MSKPVKTIFSQATTLEDKAAFIHPNWASKEAFDAIRGAWLQRLATSIDGAGEFAVEAVKSLNAINAVLVLAQKAGCDMDPSAPQFKDGEVDGALFATGISRPLVQANPSAAPPARPLGPCTSK